MLREKEREKKESRAQKREGGIRGEPFQYPNDLILMTLEIRQRRERPDQSREEERPPTQSILRTGRDY